MLGEIANKYFFLAFRELPNGNARATASFYVIHDMGSDEDILDSYDEAISIWHAIGVVDEYTRDRKKLLRDLREAFGSQGTFPQFENSNRVTVTHEIPDHVIRITAVRRDGRGREAEQWKAQVPDDDRPALAAAIRKGAEYARTLAGEPFE